MKTEKTELFENIPVSRAVISLALPAVMGQIITVIYNIADAYFIGELNDASAMAAAQLAMPFFIFFNAIANMFGIGGASLISRSLGRGDRERARSGSAFCIWSAAGLALIYGTSVGMLRPLLLPVLGASTESYGYCYDYMFWTITIGALPTVLSNVFAHLIRAEGYSASASFGIAMGGILNMILDPIFIFTLGMNVIGAAIATMLSNLIACIYFIIFITVKRRALATTLNVRAYTVRGGIPLEIITVGAPGFCVSMMAAVSNIAMNRIISGYSDDAVAGWSIAKKIDMLAFAIAQGMTQGSLPLIGYNFTSGNRKRMNSAIKTTLLYSLAVAAAGALLLIFCADYVCAFFIDDEAIVGLAAGFLKIIALVCITTAPNFLIMTIFQATGHKVRPLILSLLRKGLIDVPFMLLLDSLAGVSGIAWATPIADAIALLISATIFLPFYRELKRGE